VEGEGRGREKEGTLARKPLDFEKSFEVDVFTEKVGGSLLFERRRRELPWGF